MSLDEPSVSYTANHPDWHSLAEFTLSSQLGSDNLAWEQVADLGHRLNLPSADLARLKTAIAEAVLNIIDHSNRNGRELSIRIRVLVSEGATTTGSINQDGASTSPPLPDLAVSQLSRQTSRSWGFFLITRRTDEEPNHLNQARYTVEVFLYQEGD